MKATPRLAPDRGKIDITQGDQVRYWTRHLKVTPDKLLKAVEKVGPSVAAVRKQLSFTEPTPAAEDGVAVAAGK